MGSKIAGGSPELASSFSSPPQAICCMCGDHGLVSELFRCRVCFFRSQHRYCSSLYPKAHSYKTCNWCLREEIRTNKFSSEAEPTVAENNISALIFTPIAQRSSGCSNLTAGAAGGRGGGGLKLTHRSFSPLLNKPVKKQRVMPTERPQSSGAQLLTRSRKGRPVLRGKVRRYKLLEEVIC